MSNLFGKSKAALSSAKHLWKHAAEDDAFISMTCFNIQQCIEFALKYLIELSGNKYRFTHDLTTQLNLLETIGVSDPILHKIAPKADMYTRWEAESRYKDDFTALRSEVSEAFNICDELISLIANKLTPITDIPAEGLVWCRKNAPEPLKNLSDEELWKELGDMYYKYVK